MAAQTQSVLFTDLVGSTEFFASLGARAAERLRVAHFEDLAEQIARFRGIQGKTLGDGVMARFSSAADAIECAIEMQQVTARRAPVRDHSISIRVGISSGDVELEGADCHGSAVIEASRLCARAASGQILISDATRLLARGGDVKLRAVGELELKGLPEAVVAWEVEVAANATRLRVLLADDAVLVREGIAKVLEQAGLEVVGQAGDAEEVVRLAAELRPHVAVVDVRMPPTNTTEGLEAAVRMRRDDPGLGVLVLSQDVDAHSARRLLDAGTQGIGYLLKERVTNVSDFAKAIRRVAAGGTAFEAEVIASFAEDAHPGEIRELAMSEIETLRAQR